MQFYDAQGVWTIYAYASDNEGLSDMNSTITFTYNDLEAWTMSSQSINFGTIHMGDTNILATDNPITITNTGNHDLTGEMKIKGQELKGQTNPSEEIPAANFSINVNNACGGDAFIDDTYVTVSSFSLDRGASSHEQIYFCLEEVPKSGLTAQTYSTTTDWNLNSD